MRNILMLGGLLALAACGSDGGSDSPITDYSEDAATAARIVAQTEDLARTQAAAMPTRGRAEYDGVVGMAFGTAPGSLAGAQIIGDLDLDADFGAGTVRGTMDDFNTRDGRELDGTLRVSDGAISGSGFSGTASGTLTGGADAPGAVDATIDGGFLGADARAIAGSGTGTSAGGQVGLVFRGLRDSD